MDLAKLKKLEAEASKGPWEVDEFPGEDGYGLYRVWMVRDTGGKSILDTLNSEAQEIHDDRGEGPDGPEGSRWDEMGRKDVSFIAEMRNATPNLIAELEELRVAARALVEAHSDTKGYDFTGWCRVLADKVAALEAALCKAEGK